VTDSDFVEFDLPSDGGPPSFTIQTPVRGEGKYIKRTPHPGYGHICVALSRFEGPAHYRFEWRVDSGSLPFSFLTASALEGVQEALIKGRPDGVHVAFLVIAIVDGSYHETDTTPHGVSVAASLAVRDALAKVTLARI
jgi:elongation factor G